MMTGLQWLTLTSLARGERDYQLARELAPFQVDGIYMPCTVRSVRRSLYRELGARNGAHAVALAARAGII